MEPATIQQQRDALIERSTEMLKEMNGLPSYDALKPRIRAATTKILDTVIEYVGDAPLYEHQAHHLVQMLTSFTGMISGSLTRLELSEEDVQKTVDMAKAQIMRSISAAAIIPTELSPEDLN